MAQNESEIRYLTPPTVDVKKKKYCRFRKARIKFIDYKDPEFLKKFLNEQGSQKNYRYFCEIPEKSCNCCKKSKTPCFVALRNRFDEIIKRRTRNADYIIDRYRKSGT